MRYLPGSLFFLILSTFLFGCSSKTPEQEAQALRPQWTNEAARKVDNGYIVYVGTGEDTEPQKAQFIAEGMALEDLANECSFAPKGTRIEDRYVEKLHYTTKVYAKVAIDFETCESAKKAVNPADIQALANESLNEKIKKYQENVENLVAENGEEEEGEGGEALQAPAAPAPIRDDSHFYAMRQYVAFQK